MCGVCLCVRVDRWELRHSKLLLAVHQPLISSCVLNLSIPISQFFKYNFFVCFFIEMSKTPPTPSIYINQILTHPKYVSSCYYILHLKLFKNLNHFIIRVTSTFEHISLSANSISVYVSSLAPLNLIAKIFPSA